jgi:hypothetical protein
VQLRLKRRLPRSEICHFVDSTQIITSLHRTVSVARTDEPAYSVTLPSTRWDVLAGSRLLRRALRLDKCNVAPVGEAFRNLVIVRGYKVYHYEAASGILSETLALRNCRNVLHQSICVADSGSTVYFGEYGGNKRRREVPVYRSLDGGRTWETVFLFPAGKIKHVHGCFRDPIDDRIWVLTGDFANENYIVVADRDFKQVEWLGNGSQMWRACNVFFERERVAWIMDSQLEASRLVVYDRASRTAVKGESFPGPVWYIKRLSDGYYVAATACEIGPGVQDEYSHLFVSTDLENWTEVRRFAHDNWPKRYFKFGVIGFADGQQASDSFYVFGEALRDLDGRVYECSLVSDGCGV